MKLHDCEKEKRERERELDLPGEDMISGMKIPNPRMRIRGAKFKGARWGEGNRIVH